MNLDDIRLYALAKPGTTEHFPFDDRTLVFKVGGKMYLLIDVLEPFTMNVKCDPERAAELREQFEEITGGYHMNKKYWNTVSLTGRLGNAFIRELIDHSYDEVMKGLPRRIRETL